MHAVEIDKLIISRSKNWDFDRITLIDKLILRMALSEMMYVDEVPPKVSIAEGVEIAKQFSTEDSSSFINGILDSVYNEIIKGKEKTV
jgi:N utilization substance protein B